MPQSWQSVIWTQGYATHPLQGPALEPKQRPATVQCVGAKLPPSSTQNVWTIPRANSGLSEVTSSVAHVKGGAAVLSNVQQPARVPVDSRQPATLSQLANENVPFTLLQNAGASEALVDSPKTLIHTFRDVIWQHPAASGGGHNVVVVLVVVLVVVGGAVVLLVVVVLVVVLVVVGGAVVVDVVVGVIINPPQVHAALLHSCPAGQPAPASHCSPAPGSTTPSPQVEWRARKLALILDRGDLRIPLIISHAGSIVAASFALAWSP